MKKDSCDTSTKKYHKYEQTWNMTETIIYVFCWHYCMRLFIVSSNQNTHSYAHMYINFDWIWLFKVFSSYWKLIYLHKHYFTFWTALDNAVSNKKKEKFHHYYLILIHHEWFVVFKTAYIFDQEDFKRIIRHLPQHSMKVCVVCQGIASFYVQTYLSTIADIWSIAAISQANWSRIWLLGKKQH